jgi:myo-inositol-1(or 4)-monophosphatase
MAEKQLLHLVIGGEMKALDGPPEFRDLSKVDLVGAYPNYQEAVRAWRSKAQETVDNALMRYFVIHAHRLLDPETEGEDHDHDH